MATSAAHPLVDQLRFTRSEFRRGLRGTPAEDGVRRLEPMNSIGWIVAHMAWHEQRYWLTRAQDIILRPELNEIARTGGPATTPPLRPMLAAWKDVTEAADPWLDGPAFLGAWVPSPAADASGADLRPDAILITHEHSDHFH